MRTRTGWTAKSKNVMMVGGTTTKQADSVPERKPSYLDSGGTNWNKYTKYL